MDLPTKIHLEPTIKCNLKCIMCNHCARSRNAEDMSFEKFKYVVDQFPNLKKITLHGFGEPLLNKDFFLMIDYAKKRGIYVLFNSNFVLLTKELAEKLVDLGVDEIRASIDTSNKKKYQEIKGFDMFDKVIENLKTLINIKKEKNSVKPCIKIVSVLMKSNLQEFPEMIRLFCNLGVDEIIVQNLVRFEEKIKKYSADAIDKKEKQNVFNNAREIAKKKNINVSFPPIEKTEYSCIWPWVSCFITAEGFMTPCCVNCGDPRVKNFGNVFEKSPKEIWNSINYEKFREEMKLKNPPKVCKECIVFRGYFKDFKEIKNDI